MTRATQVSNRRSKWRASLQFLSSAGRAQAGSIAIMTAFGFTIAVTGMGYAIDVHMMQSTGMRMQDVADAAALAGASKAAQGVTSSSAIQAESRRVAMAMLAGTAGTAPTVQITPVMGPNPEVTVHIQKSVSLFFGQLLPNKSAQMGRTATAVGGAKTAVCMLVLDPSASSSFSMQGTPDLVAPDCAVQVNSTAADAVHMGGNASALTDAFLIHGKPTGKGGGGGNLKPAPTYESPLLPDPIGARITWPSPSGCDFTNGMVKKSSVTLSPGVYCGGIGAETHASVTLTPGVYVIKTGGLSLGAGGSIKGASGVTIVLLDPKGVIDIGSKGSLEIAAPKTGPWANIAVAVKPQPTVETSNMQGGGEMKLDGIVYLPSQTLHLTGGGEMEATLTNRMFVVNRLSMSGNGQIRLKGDPGLLAVGGSVYLKR